MSAMIASIEPTRARVRIAIPAWRLGARRMVEPELPAGPTFEDFKTLLDTALQPTDMVGGRFTKSERRQIAFARQLREALYEVPRVA